jgi:phosphatidylinositol alpha 1,6-mannosyltransferase
MTSTPRVAFFTDSFHEVNGVALTSRQFEAFARQRGLPFLSVHCGPQECVVKDGPAWTFELRRGCAAFGLDRDLSCDPLLHLRRKSVAPVLAEFKPDLIHITGPGDVGTLGAWFAHLLRIPLAASWHTNLHEFAGRRLECMLAALPRRVCAAIVGLTASAVLDCVVRFYRLARVLFAPNPELVDLLHRGTGRPTFLMQRGIDTELFSPDKRARPEGPLTLGFVGRITPEKGVRFLAEIERALLNAGICDFRFLIVGEGSEKTWLSEHLWHAEFPGVLSGEPLARAYANMDIFVFPSHTDTFGNVILEAMASGVPQVVTARGGPKFLVSSGETGFVAADESDFLQSVLRLSTDRGVREKMGAASRTQALGRSWERVFEGVYSAYSALLEKRIGTAPGGAPPRSLLRVDESVCPTC